MDTLSNMLVTIKNGYMAKKPSVSVPSSKFKLEVAKVLEKEGFVGKVTLSENRIEIALIYDARKPRLTEIKRISKPGLRIYTGNASIKKVKGGLGITIISTSQGVMTGNEARSKKLGGEVICQLW